MKKVNIATLVDKSAQNRRQQFFPNQAVVWQVLVSGTFLAVPDPNPFWHIRCCRSFE
jgi:hypothetical protein